MWGGHYSAFSDQGVPLLSVNYEISRHEYSPQCKKRQGKAVGKEMPDQLRLASGHFQKTLRERHGTHERVPTTAETHPTADVTVVTCATPSIFLSFLPPLSHSTSLLRFGHSAPLGSRQAELYACEISTRNRALNSDSFT